MDFDLDETQRAILGALDTLLVRSAGPEQARQLASGAGFDYALEKELADGGFTELFLAEDEGPLCATLAVERIAGHLGAIAPGVRFLVLPALGIDPPAGGTVLRHEGDTGPYRYGRTAELMLTLHAGGVTMSRLDPQQAAVESSAFGYPMARVTPVSSEELGTDAADTLERWWRVAACAEAVGLMQQSFDTAVQYVKDRQVFGRPVASFQALQHRLAELSVGLEGARWLTYEAASLGAPAERSTVAAAHTMELAARMGRETHQMMGAVGLTVEHDLHLWTLRLQALRTDMGGRRGHARQVVDERWGRGLRG